MSGTVTVRTSDGAEVSFPVTGEQTIIEAAAHSGSTLISLCRKGSCGVCRAQVTSGQVSMGTHTADALSATEEACGGVLLCCAQAHGDVEITVPYGSDRIADVAPPVRSAAVVAVDRWPGDIVRLQLRIIPDELGGALQFDPGQFAELTPPGGSESRAYSFANIGNWEGDAEFYIKLRDGGYFSRYVSHEAHVGDVLTLTGPSGAFTLQENGFRPRWMVCGGTGLAPLMSMIRRMADWGDPQDTLLILGVNHPGEVFAEAETQALREQMLGFECIVAVVEPGSQWSGSVGTAVDVLAQRLAALPPDAERPDIYLCGSPGFLEAARAAAQTHAVPAEQVYEERILTT